MKQRTAEQIERQTSPVRREVSSSVAAEKGRASPWLWYFSCVGLYALVFRFWQEESVPLGGYGAGILLWAVALLPLTIWYQGNRRSIPIFELICLAYGAAYGPAIYLVPNQVLALNEQIKLSWSITTECALLASLGLSVLIIAYYGALRATRAVSVAHMNIPLTPHGQISYVKLSLICGFGMSLLLSVFWSAEGSYLAVVRLLASQLQIGITLLAYNVFADSRPDSGRLLWLCVATGAAVLLALTGGMLEGVVLPIVLVLIVRWHVRNRLPYVLAALGMLLFLVLNPLKQEYRERAWYGEYGGSSVLQRLGIWADLIGERLQGKSSDVIEEPHGFRQTMERIDLLHKFVHVKTQTPEQVPYLRGLSYEYMLYSYIPRFLWPEKPVATDATDLVDFAYGFRSPAEENKGTKIAIGQLAEAYANLGVTGIVVVMLVQGIFFALLNHVLNGPQSVGGRVIYLATMVAFLNGIGTSAVILFGSLIQFIIASALLMWLFSVAFGDAAAPGAKAQRRRFRRRSDGIRREHADSSSY